MNVEIANILLTRDNVLHRKVFIYKTMKVPFSSKMLNYFLTVPVQAPKLLGSN